jgi:hypothetical protein
MAWDSPPFTIEAHHGTNVANLSAIRAEGVRASEGDDHYLGDGIYFFAAGSSANDPVADSRNWAIAKYHAEDRTAPNELVVLRYELKTSSESFLDLTNRDGMEIYNHLRRRYLAKIRQAGYQITDGPKWRDGQLLNDALDNLIILARVVKGNFFFKFTEERMAGVDFRIPNTTILVVRPEAEMAELSEPEIHHREYF